MKKQSVIIGYSGHAFVMIDILLNNSHKIAGYCEIEQKIDNPYNLVYIGSEENPATIAMLKDKNCFIAIGNNSVRAKIFNNLSQKNVQLPSVAHSSAYISPSASLGKAVAVMPGAVINALAIVGDGVICNTSSVVEHNCQVSNFVHIAPGAVLAGGVKVGSNTFIGANAVIKEGVNIGSNVVIGAGSVVLKDITDNLVIVGNPGKLK